MPQLRTTRAEELSKEESLRLLSEQSYLGRVGFLDRGTIEVLPVNYLVDGTSVVFCTAPGTKLAALAGGADVAFEVDQTKPLYHAGWSVVVHGRASEVTDAFDIERYHRGPLRSWASPVPQHWIRISIGEITGRRLAGM